MALAPNIMETLNTFHSRFQPIVNLKGSSHRFLQKSISEIAFSRSSQLLIEFDDNEVNHVKADPVKDNGNNLTSKVCSADASPH